MAKLPEWLTSALSKVLSPVVLKYSDGKYFAQYPEHEDYPGCNLSVPFDTFDEAYNSVRGNAGYSVSFDESLPEKENEWLPGLIGIKTGNSCERTYISSTDWNSLSILENAYSSWIDFATNRYPAAPHNFIDAYYFIDGHPALWTREKPSGESMNFDNWRTSGHAMRLWSAPFVSKESPTGIYFQLEAGPHVAPDYTYTSHDLRLDVSGTSYEDAIIQLAAKIDKFYDIDGTERPNVEHEPSGLELLLIERLAASKNLANND